MLQQPDAKILKAKKFSTKKSSLAKIIIVRKTVVIFEICLFIGSRY